MSNQTSDNNRRIAKNTLMLYFRMMISMIVSLYTTRVILTSLGMEDFGIYNAVGGFVATLALFSSALAVSISRYITYALGKGNLDEQKKIFSTSIFIQIIVVLIVLIAAETVGLWFLNAKMVIPDNRIFAANCIYQFSVATFIITVIGIPYVAAITAHEKMSVYAIVALIDTFVKLIIAFTIGISPIDDLIWYGLLLMISSLLIQCLYIIYSIKNFDECGFSIKPNYSKLKEMLGFSGWTVLGGIAPIVRDQGGTILLNLFFGPVINAARGIANQVCVVINSFVINFQSAINPQIIKSYASKDIDNLKLLIYRSSRYSCCILLLLAIPVSINLPYILKLWLGQYPSYTVIFIFLVLIFNILEAMSNPLITTAVAVGKMKGYQLRIAPLILLNLPISYAMLKYGCPPETVFIISIIISILTLFIRLKFLSRFFNIGIKDYIKNVLLRVLFVMVTSYSIPSFFARHIQKCFTSFILTSIISLIFTMFMIIIIGCTKTDRKLIINYVIKKIQRV